VKVLSHLDIGWNAKNDFVREFPIVECLADEFICLAGVNRDLAFNETPVSKFEVDAGSRTLKSALADVFQMQRLKNAFDKILKTRLHNVAPAVLFSHCAFVRPFSFSPRDEPSIRFPSR
jgi:hypothetical protein